MNFKHTKLNLFLVLASLAFLFSPYTASAAITKFQPNLKQEIVYFVETNDLAGLKQGLVDLNLHLREEGRSKKQPIKVVIHGSGVKFFKKVGIDPDLEYMLIWFQDERIDVSVCEGCLLEHGVDRNSLVAGLHVWKSGIPIAPSQRK